MAIFGLDQTKIVPVLLILLAGAAGYIGWSGGPPLSWVGIRGVTQTKDSIATVNKTIDSLIKVTDSAKKLLAQGSVEDLRRRIEGYRGSLELMRRLVPDRNEVPNLMDEISTRAKIRGVSVAEFVPLPVENGPAPFNTYKYRYSVLGHYDQVGEFLSDVASLQRIIVPIDLTLTQADANSAKALGDSTGSLLVAKFLIRTFVKTGTEGATSGN